MKENVSPSFFDRRTWKRSHLISISKPRAARSGAGGRDYGEEGQGDTGPKAGDISRPVLSHWPIYVPVGGESAGEGRKSA